MRGVCRKFPHLNLKTADPGKPEASLSATPRKLFQINLFWEMVGDPGIEPGTGRPGRVTVSCRTLQRVAHWPCLLPAGSGGVKAEMPACVAGCGTA